MRCYRLAAVLMIVLEICGMFVTSTGQGPFRVGNERLEQLSERMATHSEKFRQNIKEAIAHSFLNNAQIGEYTKRFTREFWEMTDRLRKRLKDSKPTSSDVQEVLNRAEHIDSFMNSYELDDRAQSAWRSLREDLDELAGYYKIKTRWQTPVRQGVPQAVKIEAMENRLVGTYRMDKTRSTDVDKIVDRAVSELPAGSRLRLRIALAQRLRSPKLMAIDRGERKITFGSSLQDARVYDILGSAQTRSAESAPTLLYGGEFRINTGSDSDGLYSVTFVVINLGARLQVIRTANLNAFKRPIVVSTYYTKVSDSAIFELSEEEDIPLRWSRDNNQRKNQ